MASDTRDRILDALERTLLDVGVAQVTLEAVAAAAGVSKGGLLYHFPTKEAMLAAMVRRLGARSDERLAEAVAGGTRVAEWYLSYPDDLGEAAEISLFRSMVAAMRKADYDSIRGRYQFNVNHHPIQSFYLLKAVKGGPDGAEMRIEKKVFDKHKDSYYQECKMKW